MKNRKLIYLFAIVLVLAIVVGNKKLNNQRNNPSPTLSAQMNAVATVKTFINYGDKQVQADVEAQTAYLALQALASKENIDIKTKQYDFGIFVESIGGFANTPNKAWIYYVNDKAGDVAADKKEVKPGDIIEWKYEKPMY